MNQNKKGDNEFIETVVFGRCWHVKIPSKGYATQCEKCGTRIEQSHQTGFDRNPRYDSPTSPRSLLTEAEAKTIEKFGAIEYANALWDAIGCSELFRYERMDVLEDAEREIEQDKGALIVRPRYHEKSVVTVHPLQALRTMMAFATAPPDIRCKAIRSIWEGEKE